MNGTRLKMDPMTIWVRAESEDVQYRSSMRVEKRKDEPCWTDWWEEHGTVFVSSRSS